MSVRSEVAGVYDLIAGRVLADGGGRPSAGVQLHGGYIRAASRMCWDPELCMAVQGNQRGRWWKTIGGRPGSMVVTPEPEVARLDSVAV